MKIIQISASYKPAYIYGGPIQSVAKLCETIVAISDKRLAISDNREEATGTAEKRSFNYAQDDKQLALAVLTTTANGKEELKVSIGRPVLVEGVAVTYYKRWTKDHSHFSPGLLWGLRTVLRQAQDDKCKIQDDKHYNQDEKLSILDGNLVVHIHAWWNLVSVLSCLVAKWYKVPVVLSPRGMLTAYTQNNRNSFFKGILHYLIGKKLLHYSHIHATSEQEERDILEIVTPKSITVIPNLVNVTVKVSGMEDQESRRGKLKPSIFKLIFLSRIEEKKGLELLFDALSLLDIKWQLTMAGSGKEDYVESLRLKAQDLQLNEHINWIGQVSDENKYEIMANHDLLVLTSFNENFANVVIESLSVGTPVLISDRVGLSDYVIEQQLGWVSNLDANGIKEMLLTAFRDHEKREKIRQLGPEIIRNDFDDRTLANRYLQLYETLV